MKRVIIANLRPPFRVLLRSPYLRRRPFVKRTFAQGKWRPSGTEELPVFQESARAKP